MVSYMRQLANKYRAVNRKRDRILILAVALGIMALTICLGIGFSKMEAEYYKRIGQAGSAASGTITGISDEEYIELKQKSYIQKIGKSISIGNAKYGNDELCAIKLLDFDAWNQFIKPAYRMIQGEYPKRKQEVMLSTAALQKMGIDKPEIGMEIPLSVTIRLFEEKEEILILSGWYTTVAEIPSSLTSGYISQEKGEEWGFDLNQKFDALFTQSEFTSKEDVEKLLYQEIVRDSPNIGVSIEETFRNQAIKTMVGGVELLLLSIVVILMGVFFLIYNVLQISMAGDVRQLGLLHTLGASTRQIKTMYHWQMCHVLLIGNLIGAFGAIFTLLFLIPKMVGEEYFNTLGNVTVCDMFQPWILILAVLFSDMITLIASTLVIRKIVSQSCITAINYIEEEKAVRKAGSIRYQIKSEWRTLLEMAYRNLVRYPKRLYITTVSMFLGIIMAMISISIIGGNDYVYAILQRPEILIAGQFSQFGQEEGFGLEYQNRDAGEDPMETEGDNMSLLFDNDHREYSPITETVKEELLGIPSVLREKCYIMEGFYETAVMEREGILPFENNTEELDVKDGIGYSSEYKFVESADPVTIQILSQDEINVIRNAVSEKQWNIDLENVIAGNGVLLLHDHEISPNNEARIAEGLGKAVYFNTLPEREPEIELNESEGTTGGTLQSEAFSISGYLDATALSGLRRTWHGAEGAIHFLVSEKGADRIPDTRKTIYMELTSEKNRADQTLKSVSEMIMKENARRGTDEAGIFYISQLELLEENESSLRGSRIILYCVSAMLLFVGGFNYINVILTAYLSRKKELSLLRKVGMTQRQQVRMLVDENLLICAMAFALVCTLGTGFLFLVNQYMQAQVSYYRPSYPILWGICILLLFLIVGFIMPYFLIKYDSGEDE